MEGRCRTYEGIKLEICNLDLDISKTMLYEEFSKYGVVLNTEIVQGSKHCPVKAATITYYSPAEAQLAIRAMNGKSMLKNTLYICLLYTSPSPRDGLLSRMPSSA